MSMTDPVADMLTRIRNGIVSHHDRVELPASKLKVEIARILKSEGFIRNYSLADKEKPQGTLRIDLKYSPDGEPVIHGIERVSRPGRRVYRNKQEIPRPLGGLRPALGSACEGGLAGHRGPEGAGASTATNRNPPGGSGPSVWRSSRRRRACLQATRLGRTASAARRSPDRG